MTLKDKIANKLYSLVKKVHHKNKNKILTLNKTNISHHETSALNFISNSDYLKNKKIITISPGGYYGFYMFGVCMYIKEHYDTSNCIFFGASAGSMCSLFMTIKENPKKLMDSIVNNKKYTNKNAREILQEMKQTVLTNFNEDDFELDRLFISVNTIDKINIFSDFYNFNDVLNCCEASSHIPYITGPMLLKYNNRFVYDGGLYKQFYFNEIKPILNINPYIWGKLKEDSLLLHKTNSVDCEKLYEQGYQDTMIHGKETLDKIFTPL
jgi:hypothetical protein